MVDEPTGPVPAVPLVARLRPIRGPGLAYGVLAGVVLLIVLAAVGSNLADGDLGLALAVLVGGAGATAFLALLSVSILAPELVVGPDGIRGRVSWRRRIDLAWDQVAVDVQPAPPAGWFSLDLAGESFEVHRRAWTGVEDLVLVLSTTPAALARMTPEAIGELVRQLDVEGPSTTADVPDTPADPGS